MRFQNQGNGDETECAPILLARTQRHILLSFEARVSYLACSAFTALYFFYTGSFMRAIIPVAGVGSRLRPHTYTLPKVLLNVGGKPIVGHILDRIIENGFDEATIIVGYLGEKIKEYILKNYTIKIDFVEQEERLGLGHAIYLARHTVSQDPILIILGDTIFDVDLRALMNSDCSVLGVKEVDDPRRFGVAETENGIITRLVEKPEQPKSKLALVGIYYIKHPHVLMECLRDEIKGNIRTRGEFQLTDALQMMIDRGERMTTFGIDGWFDCGKPETLLQTNRHLLDRQQSAAGRSDVVVLPPVFISPKAKVSNSVLGPYATIAEDAVVENAIIRNSIISEGAHVTNTLLEDSIVGNNSVVHGTYKRINIGDSSELEFD
jgi:glucose-1-phosphate thymidylyltransferase